MTATLPPGKSVSKILRDTLAKWSAHNATRAAAALAFYTLVSLAPLVVIISTIFGLVYGSSGARARVPEAIQGMIGSEGAEAVRTLIETGAKQEASHPAHGVLAATLGLLTLLFGASGVFAELRSALNGMWDVQLPPQQSWFRGALKERIFTFGMVLAVGFLLLVSLVLQAVLTGLGNYVGQWIPVGGPVLHVVNLVVSTLVTAIMFGLIFKYVPQTSVRWKDVWFGAFVTAILFTLGKYLISFYIAKFAVGSPYGAAGSIVVIVVWVYYSALIFLYGAEFTHVLASPPSPLPVAGQTDPLD